MGIWVEAAMFAPRTLTFGGVTVGIVNVTAVNATIQSLHDAELFSYAPPLHRYSLPVPGAGQAPRRYLENQCAALRVTYCRAAGQSGTNWKGFGLVRRGPTPTWLLILLTSHFLAHSITKKDERILLTSMDYQCNR